MPTNKFKLFIENFLVYGLGGVVAQAVPLLMLPVVTRLMPNASYFGLSDLTSTLISIGTYIAIMGMYDAMYRMFFEKEEEAYKKTACSTALIFTLGSSIFVFVMLILFKNQVSQLFYADSSLTHLVFIAACATLVGATNGIISAPTRMQNQRKIFLVTNTLSPILAYSVSIPLILKGYYVVALPIAALSSSLILETAFWKLNHKWFNFKLFDREMLKQELKIAIPLLPNFLVYWIFNSCNKIFITNILGTNATGVYSVGAKLGHVSQLIYLAFAGGWQYFAFSTMKEENQVKNNSLVFEYLGVISFTASMFICVTSYPFYKIVFPSEYLPGFIIAPYLFLAPLLLMLYQVIANQFIVIKKTWPSMIILLIGATLSILLNILLIPRFGIEGAALATLSGYIVSVMIAMIVLERMKLFVVSSKFILVVILTIVYFMSWRFLFVTNYCVGSAVSITFSVVVAFMYREDVKCLLYNIKGLANRGKKE